MSCWGVHVILKGALSVNVILGTINVWVRSHVIRMKTVHHDNLIRLDQFEKFLQQVSEVLSVTNMHIPSATCTNRGIGDKPSSNIAKLYMNW